MGLFVVYFFEYREGESRVSTSLFFYYGNSENEIARIEGVSYIWTDLLRMFPLGWIRLLKMKISQKNIDSYIGLYPTKVYKNLYETGVVYAIA